MKFELSVIDGDDEYFIHTSYSDKVVSFMAFLEDYCPSFPQTKVDMELVRQCQKGFDE